MSTEGITMSRYSMGDDMIRIRKDGKESPSYNHASEDPWYTHQGQEVAHELKSMFVDKENKRLQRTIEELKEDIKRHIKEKNQLGSKNNILKKKVEALEIENADLKYKLGSFLEEKTDTKVRKKLISVIRKQT